MALAQLAIFSPLPPTPSGIADYCAELMPHLGRRIQAVYVIDDGAPDPVGIPADAVVMRQSEYLARPEINLRTPRLYHVGNNSHHAFVRRELQRHPGLTVLHDFVLHHSIAEDTRGKGDQAGFARSMTYDYGSAGLRFARLCSKGIHHRYDYFRLPLNGRILDCSQAVIVHSAEAQKQLAYLRPDLLVRRIPHHAAPPPPGFLDDSRAGARRRLGIDPTKLTILSLGFVTPPKQIELALRALGRVRDRLPPFEYWLVGKITPFASAIRATVARCGLQGRVKSTGFVPLLRLYDYLLASDMIINLRYPSALETSGTLVRAMALGRPAIVFDYDSFSDYPDATVVKLPLNTFDTRELEAAIVALAESPSRRDQIGRAAAQFVHQQHAIEDCARAYADFIGSVIQNPSRRAALCAPALAT